MKMKDDVGEIEGSKIRIGENMRRRKKEKR